MLITNAIIADVDRAARIFYINQDLAAGWNKNKRGDELRMLTGWMWVSRANPNNFRRSLKTVTAAYIDAWYALVHRQDVPRIEVPARLRVVHDNTAAKRKAVAA